MRKTWIKEERRYLLKKKQLVDAKIVHVSDIIVSFEYMLLRFIIMPTNVCVWLPTHGVACWLAVIAPLHWIGLQRVASYRIKSHSIGWIGRMQLNDGKRCKDGNFMCAVFILSISARHPTAVRVDMWLIDIFICFFRFVPTMELWWVVALLKVTEKSHSWLKYFFGLKQSWVSEWVLCSTLKFLYSKNQFLSAK